MLEYLFLAGALLSLLSERGALWFTLASSISLFYVWGSPLQAVLVIVGLASILFSFEYMHGTDLRSRKNFYALMYFFLFAMHKFASASNWLWLYIAWEFMSLASYALIAHKGTPAAMKAARQALIFNGMSSLALLGVVLLVYRASGTFQFLIFPEAATYLLLLAAMVKSAIFPFSAWLVDAMEAPTPASALLHSTTLVGAGVILTFRFAPELWMLTPVIKPLALISLVVASLAAMGPNNLKRLLAYSTVAANSLLLYCFDSPYFVHLFMLHALFKAALFLLAGDYASRRDYILELGLSPRSLPGLLTLFCLLSLAGFPLLGLFWVKIRHGLGLTLLTAGLAMLYSWRLFRTVFSGGVRPQEGMGTKLATLLALLSFWFLLPVLGGGFVLPAVLTFLIALLTFAWSRSLWLPRLGSWLDRVVHGFEFLRPPELDFHLDRLAHHLSDSFQDLTERVWTWFTGSTHRDVLYITLSLAALALGVLL
jgi:multicomponent Na+:H+ antiporter subunit A